MKPATTRRAFALPLVLMLALIATLIVSIMLTRHNTQTLAVQRDLDRYATHHIGKGFEEAIGNWMRTFGTKSMAEMVDQDGVGLIFEPDDGPAVKVSFFDGQGAVLTDLGGLPSAARERAVGILSRIRGLRSNTDPLGRPITRKFGPLGVSVNAAPEPILRAVIETGLDLQPGTSNASSDSLVSAILSTRPGGRGDSRATEPFPQGKLEEILTRAALDQEKLETLRLLLTETPIVWNFVIEPTVPPSDPNVEPIRFEGTLIVSSAGRDRASGGVQRTSPVVSLVRVRGEAARRARGGVGR